ncbi:hypothetical protein ABLE92_18320 [Gordonia sp. VNQ95]|jgi:hypothetical protein|uniref:hypothetical protein n=1 Tax=Gordonia sp. VNQ95 TaxID=3156619 RepID=UPI0032B52A71
MGARTFRMHSRWRIPFRRDDVFAVLADADGYQTWWPQIHDAVRIDDVSGRARFRSLLPVSLHVRLTQERIDAGSGVLRARLAGDLVGWSQWAVSVDDPLTHSVVDFRQQVDFTKHVAVVPLWMIRPILHANHRFMMWSGRRGLIRHLADRAARRDQISD